MAFFGIRSCDLAAFGRTRSRSSSIPPPPIPPTPPIGLTCSSSRRHAAHPGNTCFCASMDTGPSPRSGYDLAVAELYADGHQCSWSTPAASAARPCWLASRPEPASAADQSLADRAARRGGRSDGPPSGPGRSAGGGAARRPPALGRRGRALPGLRQLHHGRAPRASAARPRTAPIWPATRPSGGGSGTPASPSTSATCTAARSAPVPRPATASGSCTSWSPGTTSSARRAASGCGRCITWCPVGIDLTAEIAALAQDRRRPSEEDSS